MIARTLHACKMPACYQQVNAPPGDPGRGFSLFKDYAIINGMSETAIIMNIGQLPIEAHYYRFIADGGRTAPMSVVLLDHDLSEIGTYDVGDPAVLRGMPEVVKASASAAARAARVNGRNAQFIPLRNGYWQVIIKPVASVHCSAQSE